MIFGIVIAVGLGVTAAAFAQGFGQDFSCPYGQQGACLDYGDTVCSSYAMCVDRNATCFDAYTCGFGGGFVCKSDYDDLSAQFDELLRSAQRLRSQLTQVASDYEYLQTQASILVTEYEDLQSEFDDLESRHDDVRNCVLSAATMSEARNCIY